MRLNGDRELKKMAKTTLAVLLAGTFTLSSSVAFAEDDSQIEEYDTVELQHQYNTVDTSVSTGEIKTEREGEMPALIPGDFFYFAKVALEKIRLALTLDNVKEAELLSEYASERLVEAEALFTGGREAEALKTIQDALEYMNSSQAIVESEEDAKEPEEVIAVEDEEAVEKTPFEETEDVIRQNIISLTAAMEKVKNPKAKAALARNVEKTYAKIAKKLEKETKVIKEDLTTAGEADEMEPVETVVLAKDEETNLSGIIKKTEAKKEDAKEAQIISKQAKKQEKQKTKQTAKEQKQVHKENKDLAKETKKQAKLKGPHDKKASAKDRDKQKGTAEK